MGALSVETTLPYTVGPNSALRMKANMFAFILNAELGPTLKDYLPHLFHGFRNKYFNKISFDNMLYFHY